MNHFDALRLAAFRDLDVICSDTTEGRLAERCVEVMDAYHKRRDKLEASIKSAEEKFNELWNALPSSFVVNRDDPTELLCELFDYLEFQPTKDVNINYTLDWKNSLKLPFFQLYMKHHVPEYNP